MEHPVDEDERERAHDRLRLQRIEYAMWGVRGDNGIVTDVRALRDEVKQFIEEEDKRREADSKDRLSGQRAVILALFAALISLLGIVATLIVVVSQ